MNACIFANGELDFQPTLARNPGDGVSCDCIIAADGGARHCLKLGIKPDLIIGDMDSIDSVTEATLAGIEEISFPREKDKTDTECAIDEALRRKYSQVTILGGVGGRIDHTMGNMALAIKYAGKVALVTKDGLLIGLGAWHECKLNGPIGSIVSIVAWGESAKVQTKGLKYPINNEVLETGSRGISNEISKSTSSIFVINGTILLFIEKNIRFCFTHHDKTFSNSTGNGPG
jgi:thiamine pyrophosphokinase